jgi:hypothetical protein
MRGALVILDARRFGDLDVRRFVIWMRGAL